MAARSKKPAAKTRKSTAPNRLPSTSSEAPGRNDLATLDAFCREVALEEITSDRWSATHDCLDLSVFAFISRAEAATGCTKTVCYSRTILRTDNRQTAPAPSRERRQHHIEIPRDAKEGDRITLTGYGDERNGCFGSLHIIIKIRNDIE